MIGPEDGRPMLAGLRVIDLSTVVFGPYCTQILADFGAEVIKVEAPGGDGFRNAGRPAKTPGMGPAHIAFNRNKKSLVLDLKQDASRAKLRDLAADCDVFIHNVRADGDRPAGLRLRSGARAQSGGDLRPLRRVRLERALRGPAGLRRRDPGGERHDQPARTRRRRPAPALPALADRRQGRRAARRLRHDGGGDPPHAHRRRAAGRGADVRGVRELHAQGASRRADLRSAGRRCVLRPAGRSAPPAVSRR